MADMAQMEQALRNASAAADRGVPGAAEDVRALATALKSARRPPAQHPMARVNEGIAHGLGGVVDMVAADFNRGLPGRALAAVRGGPITDPVGGSESIRRGMDAAGVARARGEPTTMGGQFAQGAGEALGFVLPAGALTKAIATLGGVAGGVGQQIYGAMATRSAPVVEAMAGGGARAAGEAAAEVDPRLRPLGELAGGVLAGVGPGAAARMTMAAVNASPITGTALRAASGAIAPFTEAGARVRASDRMRSLAADPEAAAARLAVDSPLTPAQQSGEEGLMALEKSVLARDPKLRERFAARDQGTMQGLRDDIMAPASGRTTAEAREFIEKRRETFLGWLEKDLVAAQRRADQRMAKLAPRNRETVNSTIVREKLDKALKGARTQEDELWARVPAETLVPTDTLKARFAELAQTTSRAQQDDIPSDARRLVEGGQFGSVETVREMHGLYSRLREVARNPRAGTAPARNRARIADQLADAILVDLGAAGTARSEVGDAINTARAFSRAMAETFEQGTVGRVLGRTRDGGDALDPGLTLGATVGRGGARGAVAVDDLRRATPPGAVDPPLLDYLRGQFLDRAAPRGQFSADRADDFMRGNRETINRLPTLAEELGRATGAARQASVTAARTGRRMEALRDPRRSAGAAFLRAQPGDEVARGIFASTNPRKVAQEVRRQATADETGNALRGLKGGVLDHLIAKAGTGSFDQSGQQLLSGNALLGQLRDRKTWGVVTAVLDPGEVRRLSAIAETLQKMETGRRTPALDAPIDDMPNSIISFIGRTVAARSGAKLGKGASGASLLTAGFASKRMQQMLESLTNDRAEALIHDAVQDRELFRALLTIQDTPAAVRHAESTLGAWLGGYAGAALLEDE